MAERLPTRKRIVGALLVGLGCFLLALVLAPLLAPFKWRVTDIWVRRAPRPRVHDADVVIAVIDQASLDYYRDTLGYGYAWPWRRDILASVIEYITRCGARAIVLDIEFPDRHPADADLPPEEQTDPVLLDAVERSGCVCAAIRLLKDPVEFYGPNAAGRRLLHRGRLQALVEKHRLRAMQKRGLYGTALRTYRDASLPFQTTDGRSLVDVAGSMGNVSERPDPDGIFRRLHPVVELGGITPGPALLPNLSLAVFALEEDRSGTGLAAGPGLRHGPRHLRFGSHRIPVGDDGAMLLKYYGPADVDRTGRGRTFDYVSMGEIMRRAAKAMQEQYAARQAGESYEYADADFEDRIVLVGANVAGLYDMKSTPFSDVSPGVEIHATAITNILRKDFATAASPALVWLLALLFALLTSALVALLYRARWTVPALAALLVSGGLIGYGAYASGAVLLDVLPLWAATLVSFIGTASYNFFTEGRRRLAIKGMFQTYVAPTVVEQMIQHPELYKLGGERRTATVFFSDIRGFTSISEMLGPEEVIELLNVYLTPVSDVIMRHRGTLDKYIGDAVVAVYGAPLEMDDHALVACRATLEILEALDEEINPEIRRRGWPEIRIGCGVNTDTIVAGNMGSEQRKDYTVIGDGVNLASRLEGLNKYYGTRILIGPETARRLDSRLPCRLVDRVAVKGRREGVEVYELLGHEISDERRGGVLAYEAALKAHWDRQWDEALAHIEKALSLMPSDGPAVKLKQRVEELKQNPPPADWSGVTTMDEK